MDYNSDMTEQELNGSARIMCGPCAWAKISGVCVKQGLSVEEQNARAQRQRCADAAVLGPNGTVVDHERININGHWGFVISRPPASN